MRRATNFLTSLGIHRQCVPTKLNIVLSIRWVGGLVLDFSGRESCGVCCNQGSEKGFLSVSLIIDQNMLIS